ncbi:DNA cytosine methyltransferase, partial [Escherichia coli]|uniref:DNA cytosine methyltransferase n=1 Tax=Escherichia coli TaxID=562 RepID=UPI00234073A0
PSETMIWQPEFTDKTLSRKPGAVHIDRGWSHELGETDFHNTYNMDRRPRMLTPRECSRLMGFDKPGESVFRIPVSNTQAYRQFGNSVVVDVFAAVAKLLKSRIEFAASQRLRQFYDEVS